MIKRTLVISNASGRQTFLADLLVAVKKSGGSVFVLARSARLRRRLQREQLQIQRSLIPQWPGLVFFLSLPFLWLIFGVSYLFRFWHLKPQSVLLVGWREKILVSPIARWCKVKTVWLESPDQPFDGLFALVAWLYRHQARQAELLVFGTKAEEQWRALVNHDKIGTLYPAPRLSNGQQENLFKSLANRTERGRFVVGSVLYGLPKDQAERLLSALAIARSIGSGIELVIIGEGKNRRQIQWLTRRMGLDRSVWLAGPAADFSRWITHVDVYVIASNPPSLDDASWAMNAMAGGLPVIAPSVDWLSDIITDETGGLLNINDPEILAQKFIALQQDEEFRMKQARAAKQRVEHFSFEKLVETFKKHLF